MIGPIIQESIQSLHIENGRHLGVLGEALHLLRNLISLPRQSWVPVSGLSSVPLLIKYDIRQPPFHGTPDQPAILAFAQILIFWNPKAKFNQRPMKCRGSIIDTEPRSYLRIPVGRLIINSELTDSAQPHIARQRRVKALIFPGRPIAHLGRRRKLWTN
jgi:hypothetical protein